MNVRPVLAAALAACLLGASTGVFAADPGFASAAPKTKAQRGMVKVIQHWHDTYNGEVGKMISETYAKDADVEFTGGSISSPEQFLKVESAIKGAVPGRYMRIDNIYFIGNDNAFVQAVILDHARPDFFSPWCTLLTFRNGKIVKDQTYLDPAKWPGIDAAGKFVTPGGIGAPKS